MSVSKITLIGLYNYDNTLFDRLSLPAGIDKSEFINALLLSRGEFEVLYATPVFMQSMIGVWGKKWYKTFEKWHKALGIEYNPLENYDRVEEYTDTLTGNSNTIGNGSIKDVNSSDAETKRSAFDSSNYNPYEKVISGENNESTTSTTATNSTQSTSIHNARLHGNIGVTTSQQMLQSELDIATWNLYDHMADLFVNEFLIPVYE